jgi:hypothetical protein
VSLRRFAANAVERALRRKRASAAMIMQTQLMMFTPQFMRIASIALLSHETQSA